MTGLIRCAPIPDPHICWHTVKNYHACKEAGNTTHSKEKNQPRAINQRTWMTELLEKYIKMFWWFFLWLGIRKKSLFSLLVLIIFLFFSLKILTSTIGKKIKSIFVICEGVSLLCLQITWYFLWTTLKNLLKFE